MEVIQQLDAKGIETLKPAIKDNDNGAGSEKKDSRSVVEGARLEMDF